MIDALKVISTPKGKLYVRPSHVSAIAAMADEAGRHVPGMCAVIINGAPFPIGMSMESAYEAIFGDKSQCQNNVNSTKLAA